VRTTDTTCTRWPLPCVLYPHPVIVFETRKSAAAPVEERLTTAYFRYTGERRPHAHALTSPVSTASQHPVSATGGAAVARTESVRTAHKLCNSAVLNVVYELLRGRCLELGAGSREVGRRGRKAAARHQPGVDCPAAAAERAVPQARLQGLGRADHCVVAGTLLRSLHTAFVISGELAPGAGCVTAGVSG
jgi:hypothetical protein